MRFAVKKLKFYNVNIEYTFPVRGHSFLPADRVFGRIEQDIRKISTILLSEGYHHILTKHDNVYEFGTDWQCFDYKASAVEFCISKRTSRFGDAKVLRIVSNNVGF